MTPKGIDTREWTHWLLKNYTFIQQKNVNNKTWNSGMWNKRLSALASGRQAEKNIKVIAHAKYLLKMRTAGPVTVHSNLLHSDKYYSFEEDLYNHIHETMMILSTGCPMTSLAIPLLRIG